MLGSVSAIREMNVTSVPAVSKEGGGEGGCYCNLESD